MAYFKQSDIGDSIARILGEIESEPNLEHRCELIVAVMESGSGLLTSTVERLCYEMRVSGTPVDVIAVKIGISTRAVKRLVRRRAELLGVRNPLKQISIDEYIDIREFIDS
jgi:hypothetical protein